MEKESYLKQLALRVLAGFAVLLGHNLIYGIIAVFTLHFSYFFFSIFVPSALIGNKIATLTTTFEFIPACVAVSAYILLALLVFLTKGISWNERLQMIVYGWLAILAFNLLRIEILLLTFFSLETAYDTLHLFVWKFMSTVFVVLLWLGLARLYKVKAIPVFSDIKALAGMIRKK
ncbi:MAG: pacearchaeosortase [Candidatus Nanoarchaeia archaeon]|nr:pacearchaeosortase [Candidatus Nanoarchaeia archaeon]